MQYGIPGGAERINGAGGNDTDNLCIAALCYDAYAASFDLAFVRYSMASCCVYRADEGMTLPLNQSLYTNIYRS